MVILLIPSVLTMGMLNAQKSIYSECKKAILAIGGGVYIVYPPHTIPTGPGGDIVCTEQQETLINDVSAQLNRRQNKNLETPGGPRCHHGIVHLPD